MSRVRHRFDSTSFKAAAIAALTLMLLWPLWRVESLVSERQSLRHDANDVIAAGFGGPQLIGAPLLRIATEEVAVVVDPFTKVAADTWGPGAPVLLAPENVNISADVRVEERVKGIYTVPVYVAKIRVTGAFKPEAIARALKTGAGVRVTDALAAVQLPLPGLKYVRALDRFEIGGRSVGSSGEEVDGFAALSAPVDLKSVDPRAPLEFRIEFELAGSDALKFMPIAGTTRVTARVAWPHPDFDGAFLPVSHVIGDAGYTAEWTVLGLNRAIPEQWRGNAVDNAALSATGFGVKMLRPSDLYSQNYRAVRYGVLFVAVTFVCLFACEHVIPGLRLRPMHYLLMGLALAIFYLLLLAFSEHLGFAIAYLLATTALVSLLTTYLSGIVPQRRIAACIGAGFAVAYAVLYVILLSQDYALLYGSVLLFAILAALMVTTRRLDWRRFDGRGAEEI